MKKMWKRFVSLLLACTLLAGMLPLSASAQATAPESGEAYEWVQNKIKEIQATVPAGEIQYTVGKTYRIGNSDVFQITLLRSYQDNEGNSASDAIVLILPGDNGENYSTPDYNSAEGNQPWAQSHPSQIYIAKGVTGIGNYTFASNSNMNKVVFQDASTLNYIGQRAFYDDDNAVFTDEGNGDGTTLDLSGVTTMGEYAFYNCDKLTGVKLGNMTAVETVEGETEKIENKIPNHAFTSTGVQSITVPSGITEVGEYAFYDCPLNKDPYISLQEGLATIGDYAFGKNDAAPNTMMTSLTIPSSVESIGDHAFYNYTGLQTVTVLGKDNGGAGASALTHVGGAAFGDADHNAYSTTTTIQDAVHPEIEYTGLVGTQFYLPKELEKNDNLFVNGETCYTGNISPLTFELTVPATCTTDGYNQYYQTAQNTSVGGEALTLHVRVKIPALGHDWDKKNPVKVDATCTNNAYTYEVCKNDKTHHRTTGVVQNSALGHNYEVTDVDQPAINADNKTATIVTYTCKNYSVVPEKNKHDGQEPAQYQWTIPATTLEATTTDSLADIASQLPKPQGSHAASLEWAEEDTFADLQEGEKSYHVRLKVNHATFADYSDNNFTIQVKVSKAKLDFSDVRFVNADRWIGVANEEFAVEGLPEGVNQETLIIEYKLKSASDEAWSETKPSDDQEAKYEVRVTFTYDNTKYQLVTDEKELLPPSEYKLGKGTEENTGTIIGDYTIAQLNMDNIVVETPSLTFNGTFQNPKGTPQNTIRLNGVPEQSKVTFSWGDSGEQVIDDTGTNPLVSGAAITDAGTYTIRVKVEKDKYQDFERDVEVTIAPQTLTTPTATTSPTYDPGKIQTGVPYDNDGRYTMEDNTGTDAGDYAAKATVYNKNNYVWSAGDTDKDGTVEIPWRILYKLLPKPTIQTGLETATYDGTAQTPVSVTSSDLVVSYAGDVLQAKYKDELAYTATNARETDANDYTVTVQLKNKNYKWSDQTDGNITLSWKIEPKQIKAPTVTVANKVYDGKPYNTDGAEITNLVHSDDSEGILELGADHTYYEGHAKLESAPTNAGNYAVEVDFDFVEGQKATNYQIVQNNRQSFTITPAKATMEFTKKEVTEIYTAEGTALQLVEVSGLVGQDTGKEETVKKEVQYSYKYSETKVEDWSTVANSTSIKNPESQKFKEVGYYQITAKWGAGTVSNNYTATDATYTLTITQANDQKITLTSAKTNAGKWDEENNSYTTTYGSENTFTVTGTAELDKPVISYAVKKDSEKGPDGNTADVLDVDSGSGEVTIKQAGEATITVTAAETANVGAASVEYTVTVKKAKPTVSLTDKKLEVPYTGQPIEGYDKATATAEVVAGADQPAGDITYTFYTNKDCTEKLDNGAEGNVPIAVGTYYMKLTYDGDTNYESAELKGVPVTVTKARLTVDAEGYAATYDGKDHPAITIKSVKGNGEEITGYTVKYAVTNNDTAPNENAGEEVWKGTLPVKDVADSTSENLYYWYMVTADNYNPAIGEVEVKIAPAPLTVAGEPTHYTKEYDGDKTVDETFDEITVTAKDVPDVTISVAATGTYDNENAGKGKDVTLTLTLSGTEIKWDNYSYNGAAPTDGKITLTQADAGTITPKEITVTGISAVDRVYDGTTDVELKGTPETTDKVGSDDLTLTLTSNATGSIESADVGNDKAVTVATSVITLGGTDANNYKVSAVKDAANGDVKVNITQRPVNLEFAGIGQDGRIIEKAYTGQPVNVTVGPVASPAEGTGFIDSDQLKAGDVDYTYMPVDPTTDTDHTAVGSYTVTAALKADPTGNYDNYELKFPDAATLKITPAEMVVDAQSYTGTYTGKAHNVTDSWTAETTDSASTEIEITKVEFIKKTDDTRPEAGAEGWDEISFINVAQSGEYWYKVTAENYAPIVGDSAVTITINPATLTLSSSLTKEKGYDGTTVAVVTGQKVTGAQNGENITVPSVSAAYDNANVGTGKTITITYTLSTEANLGNYKYNDKALAADTQTVSETVSDCSITQAPVTVTISDQTSVYDGKEPTVGQEEGTEDEPKAWYVSTGEVFSQDTTKDNLGITLSIAPDSKDAGTYAIIGGWTNSNYTVTFTGSWTDGTAGTYTITPRPIDVKIGNAEGFYGDEPVKPSGLLSDNSTEDGEGLVEGDFLDQFLDHVVIQASPDTDVGSHYTIAGTSGEYGNYNVTFASGTYTVKQRPITITIKDHSSKYGAEIDGGIADPVSDKDYTVAITGNATTGDAIVNNDALTVTLNTTASATAAAGTYDITGSAEGEKVNNYAITWAGNGGDRDGGGKNGKYTIDKAGLKVEFDHHDKVLNGVSINITDSYNANPLVLKNASTDAEVSKADKETLDITYSIGAAGGGAGGVSQIAEINETTGEVTIHSTGTVRITAKVTANKGSNYTGTQTTWYELNIISGGQMTVNVTPKTNLAYTGDPQALLESASCSLDSAEIQYSLDNQDWGDEIPEGTNAGTYTVYVKATDPSGQYSDVTEHVTVTIDKADLKGRFAQEEYTHVLTKGNRYDSAQANELTISSAGYGAEPAKYTYRSADTTVAMAENGGSTIRIMGSAGQETTITVTVPADDNYNEGTFTYTLKISDDLSKIKYNVTGITTTYNGQPQTIAVKVSEPDSGATVMYQDKDGDYTLSEPPAYTDVQDGGYTIKFQIVAPGYETVDDGTATLTINPRDISLCKVEGIAESYTYVGHQIVPETVAVVDGSVILTKDTDYTLEYGANQEVGEGEGSVIIKGTGNYTGKVIEYFDIIPVDGSSGITASIAPNFGTYDPDASVTAEVTVTHQTGSDSHNVDLTATNAEYTISATDLVTGQAITDHGATGTGDTLTFTKPAIYDITLTLTGDHQGEFRLSYTLLPLSNDDGGLTLTVDDETQKVFTYGDQILEEEATIKVTANSTDVTDQCTLTYEYTGFDQTTASGDYNSSVLENAGVYTVTATPKDGSAITGTGTFTFLILQRDLAKADLMVEDGSLVYNQTAQEPSVTVAVTGNPTADDYTITYYNNVNASDAAKAVVTATGNNFTGSKTEDFTISPKPITAEMVDAIPDQHYTGEEVVPPVTIQDGVYPLILGYDYTTACEDKGPGEATVTITGIGNYTGTTTKDFVIKSEGAPEPSERFDLAVRPSQWTWGDDLKDLALSVTFGTGNELDLGTEYTLEVNGQTFNGTTGKTKDDALAYIKSLKPSEYTITATGVGAYNGSTDTETVTIQKIQPTVTVKATPNSLSGGGKVTLTLKGEKLPNGTDLKTRLSVTAKNDNDVTLEDLHIQWPEDGSLTAELTLPNTNETYTFALRFAGDEYYEPASSDAMVVVGQQTSGGGGGSDPGDQPADPDDTGVSDWLNTKDHLAYLAGYPGGTFGPDQNMTRAEAAQMFYNLLLEKDVKITVEFEDVPADAWYAKPVNTLASLGILSGVGNGRFDPERSITRAEFTVIAMKFANTSGGGVNIFSDVNEDDWFYSAVVDSTQYGWINGYPDGTFRPEATISRAEVTVIVNHMLGRAADRPYVIAHEKELNTFGDVNRGHWGYFHIAEATNAHEYHTEDGTESWTGLS